MIRLEMVKLSSSLCYFVHFVINSWAWLHQYNTNPTQNAFYFFFFPLVLANCVSAWICMIFLSDKVRQRWWTLHLWRCTLGIPFCRSYRFSKSDIRFQWDFSQRDPAGICEASVVLRLGQCIFFHLALNKKNLHGTAPVKMNFSDS